MLAAMKLLIALMAILTGGAVMTAGLRQIHTDDPGLFVACVLGVLLVGWATLSLRLGRRR